MNMKKGIYILFCTFLLAVSSSAISSEKFLTCDAKSESYGSGWRDKPISAEISVTITEAKKGLIIALSGHPDFVVAAMGFSSEDYEGVNYSNSN